MREFLYEKMKFPEVLDYKGNPIETCTGEKGTSKDVLTALVATTPEQKEFKRVVTALSLLKTPMQNLTKMKAKADKGERMYAAFNQAIVQTHRLSSSARKGGMQFQNFDRAFKPCFVAREGYVIIEADFAQLEFRAAADLTRDAVAEAAIRSGDDVHALAASILGIGRQSAQAKTFRPLFGGSSGTPKEKKYYAAFREKYAIIYKTQTEWTYEVAKTKQLRIASGLIFYWPDTEIKSSGYVTNSTSIFNYPIQSFSFEVVALSLRAIWERVAELDCQILNTVHDSIILECSLECLDEVKSIVIDCMTNEIYTIMRSIYNYDFKIPLGIELKIARHWADKSADTFKHEAKV
jgi:DNA polymerase-1